MILILDNIRSLHNVGSIFRTADGAGVEKIYLCGSTPSPLDRFKSVRPEIAKTALGAENTVAWEKVATTLEAVKRLKKEGCRIVAVEQAEGAIPYYTLPATRYPLERMALVFGHEVDGVSQSVIEESDAIIEIPMSGQKESLNVSSSVAIILFSLRDRNN
ncbi:MAG: RNA methyltransferase [Candidatus Harrisonbacteria bacterium CG10_big_fil_rev_8_21_14_0_10_45_28]|uniref:RNA methyltransferase n=1 Tax=Candidatus Harrisonbacteria bacterium CG10_big_fil_rev_8_21_14_0_10_45_28 TaxID=1974586 RepID=A0A2H0UNR8_9BACT|nr:MAG: RNA methyltransferase [Candidatus Harrisonbacteria bacterium CG10_big_fil_rev_8_21_14_0_10_45_28]